ncbi:hypothetical protein CC2G_009493 [Coprinopsis cinerea AmutBmut pab1-1]|nr:hypothetical protein CC2G_009493 [Coprinopsis cinerea AmutBmut pab1-1]
MASIFPLPSPSLSQRPIMQREAPSQSSPSIGGQDGHPSPRSGQPHSSRDARNSPPPALRSRNVMTPTYRRRQLRRSNSFSSDDVPDEPYRRPRPRPRSPPTDLDRYGDLECHGGHRIHLNQPKQHISADGSTQEGHFSESGDSVYYGCQFNEYSAGNNSTQVVTRERGPNGSMIAKEPQWQDKLPATNTQSFSFLSIAAMASALGGIAIYIAFQALFGPSACSCVVNVAT